MAKYVLLSFDNDEDADILLRDAQEYPDGRLLTPVQENDLPFKIVAVFKKPTQFCQCTPEERRGTVGTRGRKYGWYVCGRCKKPAANGSQVIYNLLEGDIPAWERVVQLEVIARSSKHRFP